MSDGYDTYRGTVTGRLGDQRDIASRRVTRRTGTRAATIRSRLAHLEAELAAIETIPDPAQWPAGTVLTWLESYQPTGRGGNWTDLTYVAIKINTPRGLRWYTTARSSSSEPRADAELREYLAGREVRDLRRAATWVDVGAQESQS